MVERFCHIALLASDLACFDVLVFINFDSVADFELESILALRLEKNDFGADVFLCIFGVILHLLLNLVNSFIKAIELLIDASLRFRDAFATKALPLNHIGKLIKDRNVIWEDAFFFVIVIVTCLALHLFVTIC